MRILLALTSSLLVACQDAGQLGVRDDADATADSDVATRCQPRSSEERTKIAANMYLGAVWSPAAGGQVWGGHDRLDDQDFNFRVPPGWPGDAAGAWASVSTGAYDTRMCVVTASGDLTCLAAQFPGWLPDVVPHADLAGIALFDGGACALGSNGDITCNRGQLGDVAPAADLFLPGAWVDLAAFMEEFDPRHWYDLSVLALDAHSHVGAAGAITEENLPDVACANELVAEPNAAVCWTDADDRIGCLLRYPDALDEFFVARYAWMDELPTTGGWHDLALGDAHLCALDAEGRVHCWASGDDALGPPPDGTGFVALASGGMTACAARADGATTCWGIGEYVVNGAPGAAP